jgi:hypothetical protein
MRVPLYRAGLLGLLALVVSLSPCRADETGWTDLTNLGAWKKPTGDWFLADNVAIADDNPRLLTAKPGKSILVNGPKGRTPDLLSKEAFADVEFHAEFLIPNRSNSGVKFVGLYEIQIYDSWGRKELTGNDCGGIYPRAEQKPVYHHIDKGFPPRTNACKKPGEWQTLDVVFVAPRLDAEGKKTASARFVKVILNGEMIHENVEVPYPTGHAWHNKEKATGPLLLQGDHGPVAFRNLRIRPYTAEVRKE